MGPGLAAYTQRAVAVDDGLAVARRRRRRAAIADVLRPMHRSVRRRRRPEGAARQSRSRRHQDFGGSAAAPRRRSARARVRRSGELSSKAFKAGELTRDCVVVVRYQGPRANGMPELHQLTPTLSVAAEQGSQGRAGHRRPHVRRVGRGARGDSRHARVPGRRAARQGAGRRHRASRQLRRHARSARAGRDAAQPSPPRVRISGATSTASAAICSLRSGPRPAMPRRAHASIYADRVVFALVIR